MHRSVTRRSALRAASALLLSCIAGTAFAAGGNLLSVTEKVDLAAPPAKVWAAIREFNGWQGWHPAIAGTEITKGKGNAKGTVRVLTTKDGARITEELLAYDARAQSYRYRITESPLPVDDYVSSISVKKHKNGATVVWTSKFKAKQGTTEADAKKVIAGIYRAGLDNLGGVVK